MANGFAENFLIAQRQRQQRQGAGQDIVALQQFIQNQQQLRGAEGLRQGLLSLPPGQRQTFQGPVPDFPAFTPFPQARSATGAQLFSNFLLNQQRQQGRIDVARAKPVIPKQSSSVITDPRDPNKAIRVRNTFDEQGNLINQQFIGEATLAEKIGGVAAEGLQRGTQTKIEKDVIDLQGTLAELGAIEKQFNADFFTFRGKGKAFFTALAEKAEIPVGQAATTFLRDRSKFFADSKRVFLKFRKFITGVAGGIEEFKEIAKATIDPESDSPTEFQAKFESMRDNAIRTSNLLLAIKNSGLQPTKINIKTALSITPLANIPLEISPDANLQTLGQPQTGQGRIVSPNNLTSIDREIAELERKARQ